MTAVDITASGTFYPRDIKVAKGVTVRWTNRDTRPHTVVADDHSFSSPSIPGGESWSYRTVRAGRTGYHDGTRPAVRGTLEVVAY